MKTLPMLISAFALSAVLLPSVLFYGGMIELATVKLAAIAGTLMWFVTTPIWMDTSDA